MPSCVMLVVFSLFVVAGCESSPKTAKLPVHLGMSRFDLRYNYGEPIKIRPVSTGGEDWYYQFFAWKTQETEEGGTTNDYDGQTITYASVGLQFSKETKVYPIHLSAEGYVIAPLPRGKVVKN